MRQMTAQELAERLGDRAAEPPLLLDVREPWEYEICRIPGSQLVPMGQIVASLGRLDPARETVVICHHGIRSQQVARYLDHQGFERVVNLSGGVEAWARQVDPTMPNY
jgi:rhodanese-related sulfurtransferase